MALRKIAIGVLVVALATGAAVYQFGLSRDKSNGNVIRVSGNIEIIDAEVSFKIPGRVVERRVDEGQTVGKGDIVATLETADLKAELAARQAELAAAKAALAELEAGSRPEEKAAAQAAVEKAQATLDELKNGSRPQQILAAQATLDRAIVERERLKDELARAVKLRESNTITQEVFDAQKAAFGVAVAQVREADEQFKLVKEGAREEAIRQAQKALNQAQAQYKLVLEGPRKETIDQARAKVQQAQAAVQLAETKLSYATVVSPLSGIVLSKNVEPGEFVAAGTPVITVGDLQTPKNIWLRAYIDEADLNRVKYLQPAKVTTDGYPGKTFEGYVGFIASEAEFTPKTVQTEKERTRLVYRIKIYVDNPHLELKRGMPADAAILLDAPPVSESSGSTQAQASQ